MMAFSLQSLETPARVYNPTTITYLGAGRTVVFELRLDVATGKRFRTRRSVTGKKSSTEEYIKENKLVKHFVLPYDENDRYVFIVRNSNSRYEKKFTVSPCQTTNITVGRSYNVTPCYVWPGCLFRHGPAFFRVLVCQVK